MNILIAEDDAALRRILQSLLTSWGYTVTAAGDGEEAWKILCEPEHPQLMILDWIMPGIEGPEIVQRLRERASEETYYAIIMTSRSMKDSAALALDSGADDFIGKPFDPDELRARVAVGRRMNCIHKAMIQDIAERKLAETALKESNRKLAVLSQTLYDAQELLQRNNDQLTMFSLAIEQSPASIVITDLEGTIEFVSPKFNEITGYTLEEAVGQKPSILKSELTSPAVHKELWETIKSGRIWEGELINKKKNGDIFTENAKIAPFKNRNGQITHYLAFKEDITARKKVEEELKQLNISLLGRIDEETRRRMGQERLMANQARLVAMGEMIGAIAHQWRQPLATLAMIIQRIHAIGSMQGLTSEQLDEFKANAMRQINYMSDTIEEFRSFYNKDKQTELFSPHKCIIDAIRLFDPQFSGDNIHVNIRTPENIDNYVRGFPNDFKQVVLNLLGNARDAIVESRLTANKALEGHIEINIAVDDARRMIIDISDNGSGIPDNIVNRIFDPYFTTKEEHGGTGIGLYMSRMILQESLGGFLSLIKTTEGAGFRIKLPLGELP